MRELRQGGDTNLFTRRFIVADLVPFLVAAPSPTCLSQEGACQTITRQASPSHTGKVSRPPRAVVDPPAWLTLPPTPTLPNTSRSGFVEVKGTALFFAEFGEGEPILFLHGGLSSSNYWGHQVAALSSRFRVIVMDTRGHGRSPLSPEKFTYQLFASDVIALLDLLQVAKAAVVGWSDGAITGLQLCLSYPERISRLFAFGANFNLQGTIPGGTSSPVFAAYTGRCKSEYAMLSKNPADWVKLVFVLKQMWATEPNYSAMQLASIRSPTTISDGDHDEIIRRRQTEELAASIAGSRLVIQPNVSHFAMLQNPDQFSRELLEFLV